jgi:hypothetical protein
VMAKSYLNGVCPIDRWEPRSPDVQATACTIANRLTQGQGQAHEASLSLMQHIALTQKGFGFVFA